jgi:hypothetical protein
MKIVLNDLLNEINFPFSSPASNVSSCFFEKRRLTCCGFSKKCFEKQYGSPRRVTDMSREKADLSVFLSSIS